MNYQNHANEFDYLTQFYTPQQIELYTKGKVDKLLELYQKSQPKKVPISSLLGKTENSLFFVTSPDGWVPVTDCIEKIKNKLYKFTFSSGKIITASHDHLYQKIDNSWHYARDLRIGDVLLADHGESSIVEIEAIDKSTKVYDLSVNHHNHRYYTDTICSHNSGKSLFMQNIAVNWVLAGLNGVYLSLELSEGLCAMRIDSMVANVSTKELFKDLDTVEMKIKLVQKKSGSLRIKYMPAQSNVNQVRAYLKELQVQTGMKPDFIMVDYLDLLMPVSAKVSPSDLFVKDKYVSEELRNLAKEFNILMITASQLNRSAVEEIEFDHSHISGGISKINTADNVFGIFTSRAMRERGRYQIQLMKTRSSSGVGMKVDLEYDMETLRITDCGEEGQEANKAAPASDIMTQIKASSTVRPVIESPTKTVSAEAQSTKLKQMLANLKSRDD
jgi:archaellum biogenesis ATPase FlaH